MTIISLSMFLVALLLPAIQYPGPPRSTKELVEYHRQLRPGLGARDVLKLLYQGNFGVEHLLTDTAGIRAYLAREMEGLEPLTWEEPLFEAIDVRNSLVRLNLRQFKDLNHDPELIVQMLFRSAAETKPDTLMFRRQWNEFRDLVRYGFLDFSLDEVEELNERILTEGPKPVRHTERYRELYRPAYRVVRKSEVERILQRGDS